MSLTSRDLWFITPLQATGVLFNAVAMGTSGFQSPLTFPVFQLKEVSPATAGAQIVWLLRKSEYIFPPMNAVATLLNLTIGISSYINRNNDAAAKAKLPYAATGFVLNGLVTAYALNFMVPMNNKMKASAKVLQVNGSDEKAAKQLFDTLPVWQTWNYGRAALMAAATIVGMVGLLEDGAALRIPKL